jgi:hypothetical protein
MIVKSLFIIIISAHVNCITIGSIKQAEISSDAPSIWLYNQSSWSQCLCYSGQYPSAVAFNSYTSDMSCQLFSNLSSYPFQIIDNPTVTVYLLEPLAKYSPCCSNLTWLLTQIQSEVSSMNIPSITGIALDTSNERLGVVASTKLQLISSASVTSLNLSIHLSTNSQPITYHEGLYYVGIFPVLIPYMFHIYSALNLTKIGNMTFTQGGPQRIVWLFNDTLVCIIFQNVSSSSQANFYNWPSNTLNKSISLGISNAYGLGKASDSDQSVFITDGSYGGSIWQLNTSPPYNFSRFASSATSAESPTSVTIDGCNRLWATFVNFGIRIYDINSRSLLKALNLTSTYPALYDLVLTNQYQLYLADKTVGVLTRYGSELQCTN